MIWDRRLFLTMQKKKENLQHDDIYRYMVLKNEIFNVN